MNIRPSTSRRHQRGSAFIIMLALIAILLVIMTANNGSINSLRGELRAVERAQHRHWRQTSLATNLPPTLPATPAASSHE